MHKNEVPQNMPKVTLNCSNNQFALLCLSNEMFTVLFFQCINNNNQSIIKQSEKTIRSSADAYSFLQIAKNLFI